MTASVRPSGPASATPPAGAPGTGSPEGGVAPAPGYDPRRTLPLRVEVIRQLRRRRTVVAFLILLLLPWILVAAFKLGGPPQPSGGPPELVDLATDGGLNFAGFSFFAAAGFLLVVAVAMFCGDTIASEANWASLRYLLAAPVPRTRLLRQKMIVALGYSAVALVIFPAMSLLAGTVVFGWHPLRLPATEIELPYGTALARTGITLVYVMITLLVVAGLAFLLSVSTDSPLGAVGGAVGLIIVGNILDQVTALGSWREILPSYWQFAWLDAYSAQLSWGAMIEGAAVSVSYALVLFALAFRHFRRKDIVS